MKKTSPSRRAGASSAAATVGGDSKTLVIAEKPSVMRDIARALGGGFTVAKTSRASSTPATPGAKAS